MVKLKIFEKSKEKTEKLEKKVLAEYKETLYSEKPGSKPKVQTIHDQRIWRDVRAIEENIDNIHTAPKRPASELDRTVDRLIAKIKR